MFRYDDEFVGNHLEPNEIRIWIADDDTLDVKGTAGCDAHAIRLTERLLSETQPFDQ